MENIIANRQNIEVDDDETEEETIVSEALMAAGTLNIYVQTIFDEDVMKYENNAVRSS